MIDTELTKNAQEELNLEIFKQIPSEQGKDNSKSQRTSNFIRFYTYIEYDETRSKLELELSD